MTLPASADLLADVRNGIAHLTLNRPRALNALNREMLDAMGKLLAAWADDRQIHAVVLRAAPAKAFCAGGDIKALYAAALADRAAPLAFFVTEYPVNLAIANFPKPFIALMDGITMGGGMGLAQPAWVRIVTEASVLAMPETAIGLIPDVGGTYFLSRLKDELGTYLGLTGARVGPTDALHVGLADCFLPRAQIDEVDRILDTTAWGGDINAQIHNALRSQMQPPPAERSMGGLRAPIRRHFGHDTVPAIIASLRGEIDPDSRAWALRTAEALDQLSPTSLGVTLAALRRARSMSLAECLRMELDLVMNCFAHGDVLEGIRALLVDKDQSPKWQPATLRELSADAIERYFMRDWPGGHPLAML
jgi:enoyl-CoA hydratase/carnithine racemase